MIICLSGLFGQCTQAQDKPGAKSVPANPEKEVSTRAKPADQVQLRFPPPGSFQRMQAPEGSFGNYLQNLPLKPAGSQVHLYNGQLKAYQGAQAAVVDLDVGERDLQQCADAVMRLRAEYLYQKEAYDQISFNFTNGFPARYDKWRSGHRISVKGNTVSWYPTRKTSDSYAAFRQYLNMVFSYAGTASLAKELSPKEITDIDFGDVFIQGGFPGHAVIVVDIAEHPDTGQRAFLLAQSYMPAQEIHILVNPLNEELSPWYLVDGSTEVITPEWRFDTSDLKSF